jgi:hypothetical protein
VKDSGLAFVVELHFVDRRLIPNCVFIQRDLMNRVIHCCYAGTYVLLLL